MAKEMDAEMAHGEDVAMLHGYGSWPECHSCCVFLLVLTRALVVSAQMVSTPHEKSLAQHKSNTVLYITAQAQMTHLKGLHVVQHLVHTFSQLRVPVN